MTPQDIEAALSYAYLHAVASRAGIACQVATRSHDNLGTDAMLSVVRDFGKGAVLTDLSIHVQLKATKKTPVRKDGRLSYFMENVAHYNRLRASSVTPTRILVVLFLPDKETDWLAHSLDGLLLKRCAYWLSLAGAAETTNDTGVTVYLPEQQQLSPDGLLGLFARIARREELGHVPR